MAPVQHRTKLVLIKRFQRAFGLIPVENPLRTGLALGKLLRQRHVFGGRKMAVIRPEWAITNPLNPGPEVYAPPERRTAEQPGNADRVAALRSQVAEAAQSNH